MVVLTSFYIRIESFYAESHSRPNFGFVTAPRPTSHGQGNSFTRSQFSSSSLLFLVDEVILSSGSIMSIHVNIHSYRSTESLRFKGKFSRCISNISQLDWCQWGFQRITHSPIQSQQLLVQDALNKVPLSKGEWSWFTVAAALSRCIAVSFSQTAACLSVPWEANSN